MTLVAVKYHFEVVINRTVKFTRIDPVLILYCVEIMDGSVMFHDNKELCYEDTVNWTDILTGEGAAVFFDHGDGKTRQCG